MPLDITTYRQDAAPGPLRFGAYELHKGRFQLTRNELRIDLPRIAMEVLFLLVERPGVLVSRAELVEAIWPGMDPEDKGQGINTAINRIRGALRDDPARPKYIETVIGKGYRFIAPLEPSFVEVPRQPPIQLHRRSSDVVPPGVPDESTVTASAATSFPIAEPRGGPTVPVAHSSRRRAVVLGAVLLLVLLAASTWRGFSPLLHIGRSAEFSLATPVAFTSNDSDNVVRAAGISSDGTRIAFADSEGLKVSGRHDPAPVALAAVPLQTVNRITWLPDGKQLLVDGPGRLGGPEVWLVSTVSPTEPPRLLRADAQFAAPSPDGARIVYVSGSKHELREMNLDGSGERLLLSGSAGEELVEPFWLPGGSLVMLQRRLKPTEGALLVNPNAVPGPGQSTLLAIREKDGAIVSTQNGVLMDNPGLYADGSVLFIPGTGKAPLAVAKLDLHTGALLSSPKPVDLPPGLNSGAISVAPTGDTALLLQSGKLGVSVAQLEDSGRRLVAAHHLSSPVHVAFPHAWTPDSRQVIFEQEGEAKGTWLLFLQNIEKHDAEAFSGTALEGNGAKISPDHKWLLFYQPQKDGGPQQLFRVAFQTPGRTSIDTHPEPLAVPDGELRCPSTGTRCILRNKDAMRHQVIFYALDPAIGTIQQLQTLPWADSNFGDWDVSPDGGEVVLCAGLNQPGELHIISLRTARESVLHFPVFAPFRSVNWQASGVGWFASTADGSTAIMYKLDAGGGAKPLYSTEPPTWAVPSPDGRSIAYVELNRDRNVWITHPQPLGNRIR